MLRLFLLNTVLFPQMKLPLHVFEERYKQLVADCLAADEVFGVVLIRQGTEIGNQFTESHMVGCTTRIENAEPIGNGRLMIDTRGERRFRIIELHNDAPYQSATVEYPVDEISEVPESLLDRAAEGYRQISKLRAITDGLFQRAPAIPKTPGMLADQIASAAAGMVDTTHLQKVLESFHNRERLEAAVDLLDSIVEAHHETARIAIHKRYGGIERLN